MQQSKLDEDINIDFKKIFMIFWNRRNAILKVFLSVFLFFIILNFFMPKEYKVDADLYINKTNNTNLMDINPYVIEELGAAWGIAPLTSGVLNDLINELEIMHSPLVLDRVIKENNLKIKKRFGIFPNKKEGEYISTKAFLKKNISIENKKGTNVVTIEYKSKNPTLAYNIVCSIIANYIEVSKQLHSEKAKNDTKVLENEYNRVKENLNAKIKNVGGLPQSAISGAGNLAAMSAFSKSANKALSTIQGQFLSGAKSQIAVQEETEKITQLATKLQWAKMVEEMSNSSKVLILKEPIPLRDFEYFSPNLFINILLGIIFGIAASFAAVILLELLDKKLSYSSLGENIIYDDNKALFNLKKFLVNYKNENISCIVFDKPKQDMVSLLAEFKNLNIIQASISTSLIDSINQNKFAILLSKIGETDKELYTSIKEILQIHNKYILKEILV